jgi:hypothetical protein
MADGGGTTCDDADGTDEGALLASVQATLQEQASYEGDVLRQASHRMAPALPPLLLWSSSSSPLSSSGGDGATQQIGPPPVPPAAATGVGGGSYSGFGGHLLRDLHRASAESLTVLHSVLADVRRRIHRQQLQHRHQTSSSKSAEKDSTNNNPTASSSSSESMNVLYMKEQMILHMIQTYHPSEDLPVRLVEERANEQARSRQIVLAAAAGAAAPSSPPTASSSETTTPTPNNDDGTKKKTVSFAENAAKADVTTASSKQHRRRVPMMKRKRIARDGDDANDNDDDDEDPINRRKNTKELLELRQRRLHRTRERRRQRQRQWDDEESDSSGSSSKEEEFREDSASSMMDEERASEPASGAATTATSSLPVESNHPESVGTETDNVVCPICQSVVPVPTASDSIDAILSQHMSECQHQSPGRRASRRLATARLQPPPAGKEDSGTETSNAAGHTKTIARSGRTGARKKKKVANRGTKMAASAGRNQPLERDGAAVDDIDEWGYEDRVDEWIERGLGRMRVMRERDDAEVPPGAREYGDGLLVPAWINDRLFGYQRDGLTWMWELHQQLVGGILVRILSVAVFVCLFVFLLAFVCLSCLVVCLFAPNVLMTLSRSVHVGLFFYATRQRSHPLSLLVAFNFHSCCRATKWVWYVFLSCNYATETK